MEKKILSPGILRSKQHFEILDGLRGIAALAIVIFHFMEWVYPDPRKNFIGHGFLAVDFFFCLSGFVIGYAYDERIRLMGILEFFKSRLIRLHPLVILGSVLGLAGFLLDPFPAQPGAYSFGKMMLLIACSVFLIPLPVMGDRSFNNFGLNAPAWSLFWEYAANIVYAYALCRVKRRYLPFLLLPAALLLGYISYRSGNLLGGWNGQTFWHGGVRVAYSFMAGLLIYRSNWIIKNRLGFIGMTGLLTLAFIMPYFSWNWLAELIIVLIYFPLLVSLGAGSVLSRGLKQLCVLSGNLSYPLYMTHYAAIWIFGHYFTTHKPGTRQLAVMIVTGTILLVFLAYLVMVVYDTPLRRYLNNRRQTA